MSLDGKIAGHLGKRINITGPEAQVFTHQWRKRSDAILTTAKSVICDDPQLNVRLPDDVHRKPVYVLDTHLTLPPTAQLLNTAEKLTVFHDPNANAHHRKRLEAIGVHCVPTTLNHGKIDLDFVLAHMGQDGMHDVLLEAGGVCFKAFMTEQRIHRGFVYVALKWLGLDAQSAFANGDDLFTHARVVAWHPLGDDVVCEFTLTETENSYGQAQGLPLQR